MANNASVTTVENMDGTHSWKWLNMAKSKVDVLLRLKCWCLTRGSGWIWLNCILVGLVSAGETFGCEAVKPRRVFRWTVLLNVKCFTSRKPWLTLSRQTYGFLLVDLVDLNVLLDSAGATARLLFRLPIQRLLRWTSSAVGPQQRSHPAFPPSAAAPAASSAVPAGVFTRCWWARYACMHPCNVHPGMCKHVNK